MPLKPFALVTRGLSAALTRRLLAKSELAVYATYRQGNPERVKDELLRPLDGIDSSRLNMIHLDLEDETSVRSTAEKVDGMLPPDTFIRVSSPEAYSLIPRSNREISTWPPYRRRSASTYSPISSS
jgi:hypothetical protein